MIARARSVLARTAGAGLLAVVAMAAAACLGGEEALSEEEYIEQFCLANERWAESLRPFDEDGPAILAHLPASTKEWSDTLARMSPPDSVAPAHEIYVRIGELAVKQDLANRTAATPEEAYAVFFTEPLQSVPAPNLDDQAAEQRLQALADKAPGCWPGRIPVFAPLTRGPNLHWRDDCYWE